MITNSQAYTNLKAEIQDSLDFVVLACHSIPALKGYMKAVEHSQVLKIPDPDHFNKPVDHSRLKAIIPSYKKVLGRSLLLSAFSYFEAYVIDVFDELLKFHGADEEFLNFAVQKRNKAFLISDQSVEKLARRLREPPKKGKSTKYAKVTAELKHTDYLFPSQLFSAYGIKVFQDQLRDIRSVQIPDMLQNAVGLIVTEEEKREFDRIRDLRNQIAHGNTIKVDLKEAIEITKFLHLFADKIDKHIVKCFFVVEQFGNNP